MVISSITKLTEFSQERKYISTHTARRSGITNMYLSGKYTIPEMMSVSGHKDQRTLLDYVKLSMDELAEVIAKSSCDGMF